MFYKKKSIYLEDFKTWHIMTIVYILRQMTLLKSYLYNISHIRYIWNSRFVHVRPPEIGSKPVPSVMRATALPTELKEIFTKLTSWTYLDLYYSWTYLDLYYSWTYLDLYYSWTYLHYSWITRLLTLFLLHVSSYKFL